MLRILHTNDFHGTLDDRREARLMDLRRGCDVYFDCGDAIRSGNLAIPLRPEEAWRRLAELECTASVPGNRESHLIAGAVAKKLDGRVHPVVCANWKTKGGDTVFPGHLVIDQSGCRIGIVGVMVPMVTKRMATQAASAYLWDPPIPAAIEQAEGIRSQVDCLIALTHIGLRQDQELASRTDLFDLILGGHSHSVLEQPVWVGNTPVCQTGSHARFAGRYEWDRKLVSYELISL